MRIIIILSGRVRMRIIIKAVQMYQKVRLGAKSAIYRILSSPKIFCLIPLLRKSLPYSLKSFYRNLPSPKLFVKQFIGLTF